MHWLIKFCVQNQALLNAIGGVKGDLLFSHSALNRQT